MRGARLRRLHAARHAAAVSRRRRALGVPRRTGGRASCRRAGRSARSRRRTRSATSRGRCSVAMLPELVHVYFHDTDLLTGAASALLSVAPPASRSPRAGYRSRRTRARDCCPTRRLASRGTTWRGSKHSRDVPRPLRRRRRPVLLPRRPHPHGTFALRASTSSRAARSSPSSGASSPSPRSCSWTWPGWRSASTSRSSYGSSSRARETSSGVCSGVRGLRSGSSSRRRSRFSSSRKPASTDSVSGGPGAGRILACLIVVALIVLAFGLGTGYDFTTSGLIPTSVVGVGHRPSACSVRRTSRCRSRSCARRGYGGGSCSSGRARASRGCGSHSRPRAVGSRTSSSASSLPRRCPGFRLLGYARRASTRPRAGSAGRGHPHRGRLRRAHRARGGRAGARQGIKVRLAPDTTELLVQRGEYIPGQGAPLFELRPPVLTGWDWAVKRTFDLVVSIVVLVVASHCGCSSRSRSSSTRAGPSSSSIAGSASASASSG